MKRLFLSLVVALLLAARAVPAWSADAAQPPYSTSDPAVSDEIRDLYRQVSDLSANSASGAGFSIHGEIRMWTTGTAPTGWLICDGAAYSRTTYAALFGVIGTTFGSGDGSTTFNVPNFQRRVPVGAGGSGTSTLANSLGSTGGEEAHTLTIAEIPAHTHTESGNPTAVFNTDGSGASAVLAQSGTGNTGSTGGGGPHNIRDPSVVINFIIAQ